jgi:hypothetical protein
MSRIYLQRGVAAIEFALMLVIMIPLAFGITEFGRAFYQYNTLVKATRDGARVLAAGGSAKATEARCLTVYGTPDCSGSKLLEGLSLSLVQTTLNQDAIEGGHAIKIATVSIVGYEFDSLVPMVVSDMRFGSVSTTMRQN